MAINIWYAMRLMEVYTMGWVTSSEAADILKCSMNTLKSNYERWNIQARIWPGGRIQFDRESVEQFKESLLCGGKESQET